jgi:hypothetical protein
MKFFINWINHFFFTGVRPNHHKKLKVMEIIEEKVEVKRYQWKKGDSFGNVITVDYTDLDFTYFTDGTKMYNNVIEEFLEEIIGNEIPFPMSDDISQLALGLPVVSKKKQEGVKNVTSPKKEVNSPIEELVARLSKKNIEPLQATINLNILNRNVFDMLIESADEDRDELIKTVIKVAISQIEINKLQEYLTKEVSTFITNYYNE